MKRLVMPTLAALCLSLGGCDEGSGGTGGGSGGFENESNESEPCEEGPCESGLVLRFGDDVVSLSADEISCEMESKGSSYFSFVIEGDTGGGATAIELWASYTSEEGYEETAGMIVVHDEATAIDYAAYAFFGCFYYDDDAGGFFGNFVGEFMEGEDEGGITFTGCFEGISCEEYGY